MQQSKEGNEPPYLKQFITKYKNALENGPSITEVYWLQRGGVFSEDSLPHLWKWNVHATSQINITGIGDVPPEVPLRTALSVRFFGSRIGRTAICPGTTIGRFLFSYNT